MTYANADRYMLLKQLMVAVRLKQMQAALEVDGVDIEKDGSLTDKIEELIYTIEADFTMPYAMLRGMPIHLNLDEVTTKMSLLVNGVTGIPEAQEYLPDSDDPEALHRVIFDCPNIDGFMAEMEENIRNKNFYDKTRIFSAQLIESTTNVLTRLRKWAEKDEDNLPIGQILVLINCVEVVDWLFTFTNDYYGVPENDLKRE